MIIESLHVTPAIDFGSGREHITVATNQPFTVWLNTIYNAGQYTMILPVGSGATVEQVSSYEFNIRFNIPGVHELQMDVNSKSGISLKSNTLTVTVQ